MGLILGGPTAWKVRAKGDIVIAYHWINGEPAMCLYPRVKKLGAAAFVLPLSVAHEYVRPDGYPTREMVVRCAKAAAVMGFGIERFTIRRIADIICDGIEDLVKMPPLPRTLRKTGKAVGEIRLQHAGKTIAAGEIDDVPDEVIEHGSMTEH